MAKMVVRKAPPPTVITKFLGINENSNGQMGLQLGEASNMYNFRITQNYKLKQREGYKKLFDLGSGNIQGMWYGKLAGIDMFLFCHGGHLYRGYLEDGTKLDLGTLTDSPTRFIAFGSKVYLNNGSEYKSYDGSTFQTVAGYRPLVAINTPFVGGSGLATLYEPINVLTGQKRQTFTPDGTNKVAQLTETNITSVDYVKVNEVIITTGFTSDLVNGKVTWTTAPVSGAAGSIEIGWTKGSGQRDLIEKCRFSMDYSGKTDSRVFLWGNSSYKNRRFWSELANGVPSAEYFGANSFADEGNGQYAITDIVKQYDRQKIYLENGARYSYYDTQTVNGQTVVYFPSFELNEEVGNTPYGQVQLVNNSPFTVFNGVHAWEASTVRDQTNHKLISEKVQESLMDEDLSTAVTYNWNEMHEYWLNIGSKVWVFNYLNGAWYKFDNISATCFLTINGELYFGSNGVIYKFDNDMRNDNGTIIKAIWEMGFDGFGREYRVKYLNNMWLAIQPQSKSKLDIVYVTDNEGTSDEQSISYNLATFEHADFSNWSFLTSYNPQPFYIDARALGFDFFKLILKNSSLNETVTVLSITLPIRYGGEVR